MAVSERRSITEGTRYRADVDLSLLDDALAARGEPAFRSHQVWEWAARGISSYDEMTNLPRALREALAEEVPFSTLSLEDEAHAADGTVKALFRTADGHPVEAVLMRYRDGRRSICVSSQSGCPLTCTFCATGAMRFGRNLRASEILDQVLHFRRIEPVNHLVFMGMGEPMLNLDSVLGAARRLPDIGITHRRTTISTVGWLPGLTRFVDEVEQPIRLALSIHAAGPALRSQLMPVNDRYPLADVLGECRRYFDLRRRKVFVEYVMLGGVNDAPEHARELAALLDPKIFKVNLIPYNPTGTDNKGQSSKGRRDRRSRRSSKCSLGRTSRRRCGSRGVATSRLPAVSSQQSGSPTSSQLRWNCPRERSSFARGVSTDAMRTSWRHRHVMGAGLLCCLALSAIGVSGAAVRQEQEPGLLAFETPSGIYLIRADGTGLRRLPGTRPGDQNPAWSPDGRKLVFWTDKNSLGEIYVANADGSGRRRLSRTDPDVEPSDQYPAWSPDGRLIAFESLRSGSWHIWLMRSDGSARSPFDA